MKIWHISDTHTFHGLLDIPVDIDVVIHSGDVSNPQNAYLNKPEVDNFIHWYSKLPIKYKIFVAGNHDTSIERNLVNKMDFQSNGIVYLENDYTEIDLNDGWKSVVDNDKIGSTVIPSKKIKIWGSPITPTFGVGWAFNKNRAKTHEIWKHIPDDTDVVVTHGPPKGILDLSFNHSNELEFCGDSSLMKRILDINPKLVCFGHIHNCEDIINAGTRKLSIRDTIYSNGSVVTDGKFGRLSSNGNIIELIK